MITQTLIGYAMAAIIILLMIWLKSKRKERPVRNKRIGLLTPVILLLIVFGFTIHSLTQVPNHSFQLPAFWEMLCAGVVGIGLGGIMLYHTGYEQREDGFIYPKRNKNFKYVLIAVIVIRIALSQYFKKLDYTEFTILTMIMAYLYICVWRVGSFLKFRQVHGT